jgi:hypothetical protein
VALEIGKLALIDGVLAHYPFVTWGTHAVLDETSTEEKLNESRGII